MFFGETARAKKTKIEQNCVIYDDITSDQCLAYENATNNVSHKYL